MLFRHDRTHEFGGVTTTRVGPATAGWTGGQDRHVEERAEPQVAARQPRQQRRLETAGQVRVGRVHRDAVTLQTHFRLMDAVTLQTHVRLMDAVTLQTHVRLMDAVTLQTHIRLVDVVN